MLPHLGVALGCQDVLTFSCSLGAVTDIVALTWLACLQLALAGIQRLRPCAWLKGSSVHGMLILALPTASTLPLSTFPC